MACVADNGYHKVATYSWLLNSKLVEGDHNPIVYTKRPGIYEATVTVTLPNQSISLNQIFEVKGIIKT